MFVALTYLCWQNMQQLRPGKLGQHAAIKFNTKLGTRPVVREFLKN